MLVLILLLKQRKKYIPSEFHICVSGTICREIGEDGIRNGLTYFEFHYQTHDG